MLTVVFEFRPRDGMRDEYLSLAALLRPEVERIDGFLAVERFESLAEPGKLLSLQAWRDEAALLAWRAHATHRDAQARGRREIFADYRLRVAAALGGAGGEGPAVTVTEADGVPPEALASRLALKGSGAIDAEAFASLYTEGRLAAVAAWPDAASAAAWLAGLGPDDGPPLRHRLAGVVRDYGTDRAGVRRVAYQRDRHGAPADPP